MFYLTLGRLQVPNRAFPLIKDSYEDGAIKNIHWQGRPFDGLDIIIAKFYLTTNWLSSFDLQEFIIRKSSSTHSPDTTICVLKYWWCKAILAVHYYNIWLTGGQNAQHFWSHVTFFIVMHPTTPLLSCVHHIEFPLQKPMSRLLYPAELRPSTKSAENHH